jgi:squalene synthase HpnC
VVTAPGRAPLPASAGSPSLDEAYAACAGLARAHYENFPVASFLLPRRLRPHIAAIYAFARIADDIADEPGPSDEERLRRLEAWERALRASVDGSDGSDDSAGGFDGPDEPGGEAATAPDLPPEARHVFRALPHTIRTFDLPLDLFTDLLSAFRQDVTTTRYERWDDVLDYCRRSANPVGRLVLRLAGHRDAAADRSADALCTALQLTNFWQDFAVDWQRGRLYVPAEEYRAAGAVPEDLRAGTMTGEWRRTLAGAAARTAALFDEGRAVCDVVDGRLRLELRATWLGGRRILDRLFAADFDVFAGRPALGRRDAAAIAWRVATWSRS